MTYAEKNRIDSLARIRAKRLNPAYREIEKQKARVAMRKRRLNPEWRLAAVQKCKEWRQKLREEIINTYGPTCQCCGEASRAFLQLDHMNGDGYAHRKRLSRDGKTNLGSNSTKLYLDLKRQGFPPGYRILCANCNWATRYSNQCPHQMAEQCP